MSANQASSSDMRDMMAEMLARFQDSQKDLVQMLLSTARKNFEDVLSSLKTVSTHIRDTQSLLVEIKDNRKPICSEENDRQSATVESETGHNSA